MSTDCTEPNRKACPRLCIEFCNEEETQIANKLAAALLRRLQSYVAIMAPHQRDRYGGKLLIEATREIQRYSELGALQLEEAKPCGGAFQLFMHMSDNYQLTLLESELQDIITACPKSQRETELEREIERLNRLCEHVHDRLLRGEDYEILMQKLEQGWKGACHDP